MPFVERGELEARWSALRSERSSWISHWQDISDHILPRSGRFFISDRNRGTKRHNAIYDSTATRALRVLAAGMMSGMTSPARPWFRLSTDDPDLEKHQPVKEWLQLVTDRMLTVFARSNTYRALHHMYEELGAFGTGANVVAESDENIIHHLPLTAGEYAISTDFQGNVTTLYREYELTVDQLVKEFGRERCSQTVRSMYDSGNLDAWIPVVHAIEPRSARDPSKRNALNMPWRSAYWEAGSNRDTVLRESGFQRFRALCPRWSVSGGDIYGNSPAMDALGDIKQLQHQQLRKGQAIDYKTKPPLQVPNSLKNREVDMLPGGVTYVEMATQQGAIRSAWDVQLDLSHLLVDIQDVRERVKSAFYADLFLMLEGVSNSKMTATEVAERHEEKLLMLGPVLERLHNELLDPLIEITFEAMLAAGVLPTPPQELQGINLSVELVSMLSQAQRAIGTNSMDRFMAGVGAVAEAKPEVLDMVDQDKWVVKYGDALGVDPSIIVPEPEVAQRRAERARAQQQAAQAEAAQVAASTAKDLAAANTAGPNALTDVTRAFSGYT